MPHRFSGSFWLFLEIIGKGFPVDSDLLLNSGDVRPLRGINLEYYYGNRNQHKYTG
jgi:hypothetical protein